MTLEKYHTKRDFQKTSEPKGMIKDGKAEKFIFVVQKHQASHLHFDFRLEKDGVLKSWAVPKGPTMETEIKRLAVQVEDHPIDYAKFHGTIPEGNYGAGTVEIWDSGTYIPIKIDDNEWQFELKGKKLKGVFALIKLKNKASLTGTVKNNKNNWLLFKKNEIQQNEPEKMPTNIKPMLATLVEEPFDKAGWIFEIKWDGYRAIAEVDNGDVKLYSRNSLPFELKFPSIYKALKGIDHQAVFDGEIVALGKDGKPSFQKLQHWENKEDFQLIYYVFDLIYLDGRNLQNKPLRERKEILSKIIPKNGIIALSEGVEGDGKEYFEAAKKQGLEGIMAKNIESKYKQNERGLEWLKIKTHMRQEAVICGFTKPRSGKEKFGALVLGIYQDEKLKHIGNVGTGFSEQLLKELFNKLEPLIQKNSPFEDVLLTGENITWVKPKLLCEVKFAEWTEEGLMRQPVFLGLREDKNSKEVVKENYFGGDKPEEENDELVINKVIIPVSHLSKVFWPKEGYTKGDLINYYREISKILLPYLVDRPESLLRFPNGIEGEKFFQKDFDNHPKWVKTKEIEANSLHKLVNYILCQNEETLVYMINLGCIDINPWSSRIGHLNNPDFMVLDLDPEEIGFDKVIETALMSHEVMEEMNIPGYIKTSGLVGMHIYTPLGAKYSYDQARQLAQIIAMKVNERLPKITSIERSPSNRRGKVYLDCFQNARGQTIAAPYSVRAIEGAQVSTPLEWSELTKDLSPDQFTIKNIIERIDKVGDLFEPVLGKGINIEEILKL